MTNAKNLTKVEECLNKAKSFFLRNDIESALDYVVQAVLIDNKNPVLWYNLCQLYYKQKAYKFCLVCLDQALFYYPDYDLAIDAKKVIQDKIKCCKAYIFYI